MMQRVTKRGDEDNRAVRERQSREADEDADYFVHTRSTDRSLLLKISYIIDKYRLFWYAMFWFLVAVGFDFKTPAANYHELSVRIDTANIRIDSMFSDLRRSSASREKTEAKIDLLLKFQCLAQAQRDLTLAGVDCSKLGVNEKLLPK